MTGFSWQQRLQTSGELSLAAKQDALAEFAAKETRIHEGLKSMAHNKPVVYDDLIKALKVRQNAKSPADLGRVEMYLEAQIRNIRRMQVGPDFPQEKKSWYITTLQEIQFGLPYVKFNNGVINDYEPHISKDIMALKKKTAQMGIDWSEVKKHIVDQENQVTNDKYAVEVFDHDKLQEYDKYITQNYRALTPDEKYLAQQKKNYQVKNGLINWEIVDNLEKVAGVDSNKICDLAKAKFDATNLNTSELFDFVRASTEKLSTNPENIDGHALHELAMAAMDHVIQKGIDRQRMDTAAEYGRIS